MVDFVKHTLETAPEESRPLLENSQKNIGMIPGLHAVMAESPQALQAYQQLHALFKQTSLGTVETHVVWLTLNVYHECHYCVPAHTGLAKMDKVPDDVIEALRDDRPLSDPRLETLRSFTKSLAEKRGDVDEAELQAFFDAGFTKRNLLDLHVGLAQKVMSNYINHLAQTPLDEPFKKFDWTPPGKTARAAE
ncbi:MAG: carboxymuconolactone decarboxylase family protein [Alphaproteobacteria bacterium]|jgi:alkylhydroperoxidase family enzyme|nr:carboxymuconolactone decarboxylase family protein [Alphaproteobacteria bacterium]